MASRVQTSSGVSIYNLSAGKALPEWVSDRKRRKLAQQEEYQKRIELLQDLDFPTASTRIHGSEDGEFLMVTGLYPPQMKTYELSQLSMKFNRHFDCEVVQFEILSTDYSKMVFLHADRTVEFHAKFGMHHKTRLPCPGRDLAYHAPSCELYCAASSSDVYRLNLEQGRFMTPLATSATAINTCAFSSVHQLLGLGTNGGVVECWDPRALGRVGMLNLAQMLRSQTGGRDMEVTALKFDTNTGLSMCVGTSSGHVVVFDIRSSHPLLVKDHQYDLPITQVEFLRDKKHIASSDTKILKVWDKANGANVASLEPAADINDFYVVPNSGMFFVAGETDRVGAYFMPQLGHAPRWCSFLDTITEELEEETGKHVYEDYKFVTRQELGDLGLQHLAGTNLLRPYMHGFFMSMELYHKAHAIANPFSYNEYRKGKIKEKLEEQRASRINVVDKKALPKVNADLFKKMNLGSKEKAIEDRFGGLFTNKDFEIDPESEEFKLRHPMGLGKVDADGDGDEGGSSAGSEPEESVGDAASSSESDLEQASEEDEDPGSGSDDERADNPSSINRSHVPKLRVGSGAKEISLGQRGKANSRRALPFENRVGGGPGGLLKMGDNTMLSTRMASEIERQREQRKDARKRAKDDAQARRRAPVPNDHSKKKRRRQ